MRAYFFGNMYLSSIQQGIQAAHVVGRMFTKYTPGPEEMVHEIDAQFLVLNDWVTNHETIVLLNGGYGENLHDLNRFFFSAHHPYPFASFNESNEALDGAITSVGIILPPKIYEAPKVLRKLHPDDERKWLYKEEGILTIDGKEHTYSDFEKELIVKLPQYRTAS